MLATSLGTTANVGVEAAQEIMAQGICLESVLVLNIPPKNTALLGRAFFAFLKATTPCLGHFCSHEKQEPP